MHNELKQSSYADDERREVLDLLPDGLLSFLDVGCGAGGFGRGLRRDRPAARIVGVEAVPDSADRARANGYDEVVEGYFPDAADRLHERFDALVFNDVLEHMVDPWAAIRAVDRFLMPNGYLVASIPNVRYFPVVVDLVRKDDWTYTDWGVLDRTHLRFFTKTTMCRMFSDAGYEVISATGVNSGFGLARWRRFRWLRGRIGSAEFMQIVLVARRSAESRAQA